MIQFSWSIFVVLRKIPRTRTLKRLHSRPVFVFFYHKSNRAKNNLKTVRYNLILKKFRKLSHLISNESQNLWFENSVVY